MTAVAHTQPFKVSVRTREGTGELVQHLGSRGISEFKASLIQVMTPRLHSKNLFQKNKTKTKGCWREKLRALAAFVEDLGPVSSTHTVAHNYLKVCAAMPGFRLDTFSIPLCLVTSLNVCIHFLCIGVWPACMCM